MPEPTELPLTKPELAEPVEIEIGGTILELPAGISEEGIKRAIENFRTTPEFDRMVDKKTGAPGRVRMLVGSAPETDRLANLKRFYPDAVPYGDDGNFVFSDPGTGKPTLYNPKGLDTGDVASVAREGAQAVGGGLGAAFGGAGGFVLGTPGGPPGQLAVGSRGAVLGAGLGSAAAGSLFDIVTNIFDGRIDTRSLGQRSAETATEFFAAAAGQRIGEIIPEAFKHAMGGASEQTQRLVAAYARLKIPPPAGAVTGSRTIGTIEKGLEATPTSINVMQRQAESVLKAIGDKADDIARQFGTPQTKMGTGETIKTAATRAATVFESKQETIYKEAFDLVGAETPVAVNAITALHQEMQTELARASKSLAPGLSGAIAKLGAIIDDAGGAGMRTGIPFQALREVRTMIGQDLATPVLVGGSGSANAAMKRVYAALTLDMSNAAKAAGPEAASKLGIADRFTRTWLNTVGETLKKIDKFDTDERAFNYVMSATKDGAIMLARLRRQFTGEEWDTVSGTVLSRLGQASASAQDAAGTRFSPSTFLTNWSRLAPEAKETLFGGSRYADLRPALDDLVRVTGSLKEMEKLSNTSNTGRVMVAYMMATGLWASLGSLAAGVPGALTGVVGYTAAPWAAAKLITSPSFVKWLSTPLTTPNAVGPHLARLTAIAAAEPELKDAIELYINALRANKQISTGEPQDEK